MRKYTIFQIVIPRFSFIFFEKKIKKCWYIYQRFNFFFIFAAAWLFKKIFDAEERGE